jgi:type II secretory pathway pseudopilin PulG
MAQKNVKTTAIPDGRRAESGTAMIIALMVMGLLAVFVATSLTRVTTEARIMGNDHQNTRAFYAAQAGLELMSRDFAKIFLTKFAPTPGDITAIQANEPVIPGIENFNLVVRQTGAAEQVTIESDTFQGLVAIRDPWRLNSTATTSTGEEVQLTRTFYNNRIPIFQFGIFYDDDMEIHPGPVFNFGGRVHSNSSIFLAGSTGVYFNSRVSAAGQIVTDRSRSGSPVLLSRASPPHAGGKWADNVWVRDAGLTYQRVTEGSVIEGWDIPTRTTASSFDDGTNNTNWPTFSQRFNGNLLARRPVLRLPLQIENNDPIEIVKRPRATDTALLTPQRYANKGTIRVYLGDSTADVGGGIRLDGDANGLPPAGNTGRGYWPRALTAGVPNYPQPYRLNAHRLFTATRQVWMKIEVVTPDINGNPIAVDRTADFLSLGVTKRQTILGINGGAPIGDENAIFLLQRFGIDGPNISSLPSPPVADRRNATVRPLYRFVDLGGGLGWNVVQAESTALATVAHNNAYAPGGVGVTPEERQLSTSFAATAPFVPAASTVRLVPFPIRMFDTREGLYNDSVGPAATAVPYCGVMSMVEIHMQNLAKFMAGKFDGRFPGGLTSASIPINGGSGVIVYVSDRRGDADDDGVYDMENVYINNFADDTLQPGEDLAGTANVNVDGVLQADYVNESARYNLALATDMAALSFPEGGVVGNVRVDRLFRRGVRLVEGQSLRYQDIVNPALNWGNYRMGVSVASENGVYIQGHFNATGINVLPTGTLPTPYNGFTPFADSAVPATWNNGHMPASVVADAVTILSQAWNDGKSFASPFDFNGRLASETHVRAALLMGDTKSAEEGVPNGGGGDLRMSGGVHNFKRFLERWDPPVGQQRLNYCGSLINLFNSRNNNGAFKCCTRVYNPPARNWVYDETFLDPDRMPPGTPFFQYVQMTGFRRTTY